MPNNITNNKLKLVSKECNEYMQSLNKAFLYREEEITILMVSLIIQKNACFIGSHGEAKSALIEAFSKGINKKFFGCQFNRFSTPDEILGHFSLKEMKEKDEYIRKYQGKLPDCSIAYLDECFNASGAMLQSLQKALNEKRIDLGNGTDLKIPLELAIGSTNFHCSKNPQLAAFWDRFFLRIETQNTVSQLNKNSLHDFLMLKRMGKLGVNNKKLSSDSIEYLRSILDTVIVPLSIDKKIYELISFCNQNKIEISARRLTWIDDAIKCMALINGRDCVNEDDLNILQHCLWIHIEQYPLITSFLKKVCNSPTKELRGHISTLKKMKIKYMQLDDKIASTKDRNTRLNLLDDMTNFEDGMIALVNEVLSKEWDQTPEIMEFLNEIEGYRNPTKFLV